ncbi:YfjI family protein, partial [Propionivibrio sp.]|uniref:YfjI family protein n=1 Tax=Propionivibrio sp. TaxID=2212460 RepID=UPI003BEF800D
KPLPISGNAATGDGNGWPDPQPMTEKVEPEPYPLDALPEMVRLAVEEVARFVQAPFPMVASCALSALSLAIQAHVDVKRAERLTGPVSAYWLIIADSGERKSTCDGFFSRAIIDYQTAQAESAKPVLKNYRAECEVWEAKRGGIKDKIRQLAKEGKSTSIMESSLHDLEFEKPEAPRIPRLIYSDVTPEKLAYSLAKEWPSGGIVSAEGGIVFGSHGMGGDSVMRNLATLNQLWDGNNLTIDRKTSESFTVRGARLTMALQVQEQTLRSFFKQSGDLARGTGFLARFLVAWPESTQGTRPFADAPDNWPALAAFNRRITEILNQPVPIDDDGVLTPLMLDLAPVAKEAWVEYHDAIERSLASGGDLHDVRDVASKSADNAVRLAALFQVFEHGASTVSLDSFDSASRISAWNLTESKRFFGELALPAEMAAAARLDSWLIEHCRRERTHFVGKRNARQHGPIRNGEALDAAIRELTDLDRVRIVKEGKRITIQLNPALMTDVVAI